MFTSNMYNKIPTLQKITAIEFNINRTILILHVHQKWHHLLAYCWLLLNHTRKTRVTVQTKPNYEHKQQVFNINKTQHKNNSTQPSDWVRLRLLTTHWLGKLTMDWRCLSEDSTECKQTNKH